MKLTANRFKRALQDGRQQLGLWCTINDAYVFEMLATCGYDWLLIDCEHSPIGIPESLQLLQAAAPHPVSVVVRPGSLDVVEIKKLLDFGAQTLLVPQVQTAEEAALAVAAVTYPPEGIRGYAGLTRASHFADVSDYAKVARSEICILVQVETVQGIENLDAILSVPDVDGVFIGPADLAASMGYPGQPTHPEVRKACADAIRRIRDTGVAAGFLSLDTGTLEEMISAGSLFTAVNVDAVVLKRGVVDSVVAWRKTVCK